MSRKEVALKSIVKTNFEIKKISKLQRRMAYFFIAFILIISLVGIFLNKVEEVAPYVFMLFACWILSHGAYSVLLIAQNTENRLQDVIVYSEDLREYTVKHNEAVLDFINENRQENESVTAMMDLPVPPEKHLLEAEERRILGERERSALLAVIGGMLRLMLDKTPSGRSGSIYENQSAIIEALVIGYGAIDGISKSSLELKFASANRKIKS